MTAECAENREGRGVEENNIGEIVLGRAITAPIALGPTDGVIRIVSNL